MCCLRRTENPSCLAYFQVSYFFFHFFSPELSPPFAYFSCYGLVFHFQYLLFSSPSFSYLFIPFFSFFASYFFPTFLMYLHLFPFFSLRSRLTLDLHLVFLSPLHLPSLFLPPNLLPSLSFSPSPPFSFLSPFGS